MMNATTKIYWAYPGWYAGHQYDTAHDGQAMFAWYRLSEIDAHKASEEARERHLGTPRWLENAGDLRRFGIEYFFIA